MKLICRALLGLLALGFFAGPAMAACPEALPYGSDPAQLGKILNDICANTGGSKNTIPQVAGTLFATPTYSSFTRPSDTNAYAVGDLVANSTTAGSVVPMSWTATRAAAGAGSILKATLKASNTAITSDTFVLHIYAASPTIANGDNGAFSTNESSWICDITINMNAYAFTDFVSGQGVPNTSNACNFVLASGQTIYGLLETRTVYTPTSASTLAAALEIIQDN